VLWHRPAKGWGPPVADTTTVYFQEADHSVVALNRETGHLRWKSKTGEASSPPGGNVMLLVGSMLIVGDHALIGLDRSTGNEKWRFSPQDTWGVGSYLADGGAGIVLAGSAGGKIYALNAETGRAIWSRMLTTGGDSTVFSPLAAHGRVVATWCRRVQPRGCGIVGLNHRDGSILWQSAIQTADLGPPQWVSRPVEAGSLVLLSTSDGQVIALGLTNGQQQWAFDARSEADQIRRSAEMIQISVASDWLLLGYLSGGVRTMSLSTRRELWSSNNARSGGVLGPIVIDRSAAIAVTSDGRLEAFDLKSRKCLWKAGGIAGEQFLWPPAVSHDRMFFAGMGGLYAAALDATPGARGGRVSGDCPVLGGMR